MVTINWSTTWLLLSYYPKVLDMNFQDSNNSVTVALLVPSDRTIISLGILEASVGSSFFSTLCLSIIIMYHCCFSVRHHVASSYQAAGRQADPPAGLGVPRALHPQQFLPDFPHSFDFVASVGSHRGPHVDRTGPLHLGKWTGVRSITPGTCR